MMAAAAAAALEHADSPTTEELAVFPPTAQPHRGGTPTPSSADTNSSSTLLHDPALHTATAAKTPNTTTTTTTTITTPSDDAASIHSPVSTPTGTKLAVTTPSESPAGGEGADISIDEEKKIALSQLQELEVAIKVRKVTKVDGRKIRWIEYRARKRAEEERRGLLSTPSTKKKIRRSKSKSKGENSENDANAVNNNNNNSKGDGTMKVETASSPLSVVGTSNVLESMKQQFLQGTDSIANGKSTVLTETVGTQRRKSGRTRKSAGTPEAENPISTSPEKTVKTEAISPKGPVGSTDSVASLSLPSTPSTPDVSDQPLAIAIKKNYFTPRSLTKGLREVRKSENGTDVVTPPKSENGKTSPTSPVGSLPLSPIVTSDSVDTKTSLETTVPETTEVEATTTFITTSTTTTTTTSISSSTTATTTTVNSPDTNNDKDAKEVIEINFLADSKALDIKPTTCSLVKAAARLLSPPSARSKSADSSTKGKKAVGAQKKGSLKKSPPKPGGRSESEPRKTVNGFNEALHNGSPVVSIPPSKTSDNSGKQQSLVVEPENVLKRPRGRPPKRKADEEKKPPSSSPGKSSKKLSTVVVDVHNTMNGEPQTVIPVNRPVLRAKRISPTKKSLQTSGTPSSGGVNDPQEGKDSRPPTAKQQKAEAKVKREDEGVFPVNDLVQETKRGKTAAKKKKAEHVSLEDNKNSDNISSASSTFNQMPVSSEKATQSTKVVKGIKKPKTQNKKVPSLLINSTATPSLLSKKKSKASRKTKVLKAKPEAIGKGKSLKILGGQAALPGKGKAKPRAQKDTSAPVSEENIGDVPKVTETDDSLQNIATKVDSSLQYESSSKTENIVKIVTQKEEENLTLQLSPEKSNTTLKEDEIVEEKPLLLDASVEEGRTAPEAVNEETTLAAKIISSAIAKETTLSDSAVFPDTDEKANLSNNNSLVNSETDTALCKDTNLPEIHLQNNNDPLLDDKAINKDDLLEEKDSSLKVRKTQENKVADEKDNNNKTPRLKKGQEDRNVEEKDNRIVTARKMLVNMVDEEKDKDSRSSTAESRTLAGNDDKPIELSDTVIETGKEAETGGTAEEPIASQTPIDKKEESMEVDDSLKEGRVEGATALAVEETSEIVQVMDETPRDIVAEENDTVDVVKEKDPLSLDETLNITEGESETMVVSKDNKENENVAQEECPETKEEEMDIEKRLTIYDFPSPVRVSPQKDGELLGITMDRITSTPQKSALSPVPLHNTAARTSSPLQRKSFDIGDSKKLADTTSPPSPRLSKVGDISKLDTSITFLSTADVEITVVPKEKTVPRKDSEAHSSSHKVQRGGTKEYLSPGSVTISQEQPKHTKRKEGSGISIEKSVFFGKGTLKSQVPKSQEPPQETVVESVDSTVSAKPLKDGVAPASMSTSTVTSEPSTTSTTTAKSKEKVPRILKQLFQDEGVQNMLKSMNEESGVISETSPHSDAGIHKLRPKRATEPMLSSSPDLDAMEALLSSVTSRKKKRGTELDTLYMDEGVLNLLTSLEPHSRRSHQDDSASDVSQASSSRSVKAAKSTKSLEVSSSESRKRKLSGASTVSNTSSKSMQPPDPKKMRPDPLEVSQDPYELDSAEEFREKVTVQEEVSTPDADNSLAKKKGKLTLPLSVKQKNKAIKMQLKIQKQKHMKGVATDSMDSKGNSMEMAQPEDPARKLLGTTKEQECDDANNVVNVMERTYSTKSVPPLKIKLASDSVTIKPVPRQNIMPQLAEVTVVPKPVTTTTITTTLVATKSPQAITTSTKSPATTPTVAIAKSSAAPSTSIIKQALATGDFHITSSRPYQQHSRPSSATPPEARSAIARPSGEKLSKSYSERQTPPPPPPPRSPIQQQQQQQQQRRIDNFGGTAIPTGYPSLVRSYDASGQARNKQRLSGETVRQSQRASVRQSEGNYHYRDISLRKFSNFTQIILSPSTTKMKNALNSRVLRELCEALNILRRDETVKMVLLTGTGSTFCQGVDLTALQHPNIETRKKNAENLVRGIKEFLKVLVQFPKAIVAGVNGNAMGLGVTMLPLFDMVIANDKAEFYLPYATLGQVPEGGATYTFPNLFGKLQSTKLFQGYKLTATMAADLGLVSESIWPATFQQQLIPRVALLATQSAQVSVGQ
ncbi:hypothetical protein Pcinc_038560 [Petrolisthes cinctipes]|uniref:Uncharacterized protein n=1 Tax=Petrolisthes cinctipes TaxID=88211 RepID=A0AAE1BTH3_PETCI|nr:hypothetical protein Pcinc_038560 [Petrolisthes cinctipes]